MKQIVKEYEQMLEGMNRSDRGYFIELEGILDSYYAEKDEKYDVLHEMAVNLTESNHSFTEMFGDNPKEYALEIGEVLSTSKQEFLKTFALLNIYFIGFFMLVSLTFTKITVSYLLLLVPILSLVLVPLMNRGIRFQAFKSAGNQNITTISFLTLFVFIKLMIISSLHPVLDSAVIWEYQAPFLTILLPLFYGIIAVLTAVFFFLTKEKLSRIEFLILTAAFVLLTADALNLFNISTSWIFIGIILSLICIEFIKSKNNTQFAN